MERQFATIDDAFEQFTDLDTVKLPADERKLSATKWHVELPLFDSKEIRVNMLRATLPTAYESLNRRVEQVRNELLRHHVVQAAVSGGGKVLFFFLFCSLCGSMIHFCLPLLDTNCTRIVQH